MEWCASTPSAPPCATTSVPAQVVEELEILLDEATLFLDRESGELYALGDEEANLVEDGREDEFPDRLCDEAPRIREVLTSNRWLSLPTRFDVHEWAIMDAFTRSLDDPDLADELRTAIHGRGPSASSRTRLVGGCRAPSRSLTIVLNA